MKIKKTNKQIMRLAVAATATSMLLPACEPFINSIVISEDLPARGKHAIDLDLSKSELNYLRFLQRLSDDIIRNPEIAQSFARNPQLFLEQYGFHEPIDLDEGMLKLILALGDQDINRAVSVGDIRLVLSLMEERGLLTNLTSSLNLSISEKQTREILLAMGVIADQDYLSPEFIVFVFILFPAVVLVSADGAVNSGNNFLDNNLSFRIWTLKGKSNDTYIAVDMYLENQVNKIIDLIKSRNIPFDENKMRDFLKLNLLMQSN